MDRMTEGFTAYRFRLYPTGRQERKLKTILEIALEVRGFSRWKSQERAADENHGDGK